eukprot:SAG31_NODE_1719_length_7455_cov_7.529772_6_plen_96_part_00
MAVRLRRTWYPERTYGVRLYPGTLLVLNLVRVLQYLARYVRRPACPGLLLPRSQITAVRRQQSPHPADLAAPVASPTLASLPSPPLPPPARPPRA